MSTINLRSKYCIPFSELAVNRLAHIFQRPEPTGGISHETRKRSKWMWNWKLRNVDGRGHYVRYVYIVTKINDKV